MDIVEHTAQLEQSAEPPIEGSPGERWRLTVSGAYLAAAYASDDYLADDTCERAERMLARFELAERLVDQADQEAGA